MEKQVNELEGQLCFNRGKVKGYPIMMIGAPTVHYVFIEVDTAARLTFLSWDFTIFLN